MIPPSLSEQWIPVGRVAEVLYIPTNTVRKWCQVGAIKCKRNKSRWLVHRDAALSLYERKGLSTAYVAARLGVSVDRVTRWIRSSHLPASRIGHKWFVQSDALSNFVIPVDNGRPEKGSWGCRS